MNISVADSYDNKSVTIISYAYGPGYFYNHDHNGKRIDLDTVTLGKEVFVFSSNKFLLEKLVFITSFKLLIWIFFYFSTFAFSFWNNNLISLHSFSIFFEFQTKISSTLLQLVPETNPMEVMMLAFFREARFHTCSLVWSNRITFHMCAPMLLVLERKAQPIDVMSNTNGNEEWELMGEMNECLKEYSFIINNNYYLIGFCRIRIICLNTGIKLNFHFTILSVYIWLRIIRSIRSTEWILKNVFWSLLELSKELVLQMKCIVFQYEGDMNWFSLYQNLRRKRSCLKCITFIYAINFAIAFAIGFM